MLLDLRSDTLTLPTEAMISAMAEARVGDDGRTNADGRSEDPTVRRLEDQAAQLLATEAALFVPSGTFGNLLGVLALSVGSEALWAHSQAHIVQSEKALFDQSLFGRELVSYHELAELPSRPPSGQAVLLVENTFSKQAGRPLDAEELARLAVLRKAGWKIHMDGARLFNAVVSTKLSAADTVASCDSVTFCLSKGLAAPIGSVLCGSSALIARARLLRKQLGGAMRQAGYVAAAGVEALQESNIQRLTEDHRNAETLAKSLRGIDGLSVKNHTNIVLLDLADHTARKVAGLLARRGIFLRADDERELRILTHRGVSAQQAQVAAEAIAECIETARSSS